jgi:hypothetical protein
MMRAVPVKGENGQLVFLARSAAVNPGKPKEGV